MTLKIHGAPGTGKTYRTIQILKEAINSGIPDNDIMYTTYRKEAAADAIKVALAHLAASNGVCSRHRSKLRKRKQ